MPAGRKEGIVYGLTDANGNVFYVGKTVNLKNRMAAYRAGRCHGNRDLAAKVAEHGVRVIVLRSSCDDLAAAEFDEIEARSNLANLITSRRQALRYAATTKPWVVPGVVSPSTAYMRHMKNAFGLVCNWMKAALKSASDADRLEIERRIAASFAGSAIGPACAKWTEAMDARA